MLFVPSHSIRFFVASLCAYSDKVCSQITQHCAIQFIEIGMDGEHSPMKLDLGMGHTGIS